MRRILICLSLVLTAQGAFAYPQFYDFLAKHYTFKADSAAAKEKCGVCHVDRKPPKLNPFGKDVKANWGPEMDLTAAVLTKLAQLDSDKDGTSNEEELKAGLLPGDPKSNPAPQSAAESPTASELVPKHSFHPAFSHFPLALWAVAALLEVLSRWKKKPILHQVAVVNLAIGLIAAIVTISTGIIAMLRLGYWSPMGQTMLIHLLLASISTVLALCAWAVRKKEGVAFLLLLGASALAVLAGGHFGGEMVFGG